MKTTDFEALRDYILKKNPYFSSGYANAFTDTETEAIYAYVNGDLKAIFPEDRFGNYFYLRNDPNIKFTPKTGYQECGIGRFNFDDAMTCYLVAVVNDADDYELINNLRNTVLGFGGLIGIPVNAMWQRENVVLSEMKDFSEECKFTALTNLKDQSIVKIQLTLSKEYIPNNCINNPCKTC